MLLTGAERLEINVMLFSVIIIAMKAELSCQNLKENYTVATRMDTPKLDGHLYSKYMIGVL